MLNVELITNEGKEDFAHPVVTIRDGDELLATIHIDTTWLSNQLEVIIDNSRFNNKIRVYDPEGNLLTEV